MSCCLVPVTSQATRGQPDQCRRGGCMHACVVCSRLSGILPGFALNGIINTACYYTVVQHSFHCSLNQSSFKFVGPVIPAPFLKEVTRSTCSTLKRLLSRWELPRLLRSLATIVAVLFEQCDGPASIHSWRRSQLQWLPLHSLVTTGSPWPSPIGI